MFSTESFRNMTRLPIITWQTSSCNWEAEKNRDQGESFPWDKAGEQEGSRGSAILTSDASPSS